MQTFGQREAFYLKSLSARGLKQLEVLQGIMKARGVKDKTRKGLIKMVRTIKSQKLGRQGKGARPSHERATNPETLPAEMLVAFVAQVRRTIQRLDCEPTLRPLAAASEFALEALGYQ